MSKKTQKIQLLGMLVDDELDGSSSNPVKNKVVKKALDAIQEKKIDGAFVENGYLFLTANGEAVTEALGPFSGNGSGGNGGLTYTITFKNLSESRSFSVAEGVPAEVMVEYSSVDEDGVDDGPGVGTIYVDDVRKATINIKQGKNTIDTSKYLSAGSNSVKIKVENSDGADRTIAYTINVVSISVSTTLSKFTQCSGDTSFYYRVVGSGEKTVYFIMDGKEIGTDTTESSGKSQTFIIPEQSHGGHIFECYATAEVEGITVKSEPIRLGMNWIDSASVDPAIVCLFDVKTVTQGEDLIVPHMVYDPMTETPLVTYTIYNEDGSVYSNQEYYVDRTAQNWIVNDYPVGNIKIRIARRNCSVELAVTVTENEIVLETITDGLVLDFNPKGRNNQEENPAVWTDGTVAAQFSDIGFAESDGWINDESGSTKLRILPGGEMVLPFAFFASDKRDAGATIEVEMSTHNVRDYDSVVISSLSGGRGIKIASQYAQLNSEQSEISMQFVEDKRIRVSFVIEPKNLNRLIYVYVNGIMCGALQYPEDDNFAQNPAVGITIGAESSGIDVYRILMYNKGLVATELIENFVADRSTLKERLDAHKRNNILNTSGDVVIGKLPSTLPYMIISCAELPQSKGDKKDCIIEYVNPSDSGRSFKAAGVVIDVQGTSSSGYKKKNFKQKFQNGITYTATNITAEGYSIRANSIPVVEICMKADVASSEGANNVELVRLYNDVCLTIYKTDAQEADGRVRVGIDGVPCIVFWHNTDTGETKFWGKYNLNNEKANSEVYGLTDGCESWEILNNTSNRVLFKSADFNGTEWMKDFEARYPEDNTDTTNLKRMMSWVVSTDREAVSTEAQKQERLDKFKNEFEDYFVKEPMLFYYIFTEVFMMVDSRAKNFFPTTFDGIHWMPLPYDMDTAIGINNEGQLVFDYDLEDYEALDGKDVFNSRHSVLWCNIRDAFQDEIKEMYKTLRSQTNTLFSYDKIIERFDEHQAVWPETIWNEDAYEKYLEPLLSDKDGSYLSMLQGDKSSQREWWLFNAFRYRDSKYQCGDANLKYITIRCYNAADITVTPYSHIWPRLQYDGSVGSGDGYVLTTKGKRNVEYTFVCPMTTLNDTPVYIFSADRLADIGDLSPLKVGWANFSAATKLQKLKLGDGAVGYENPNLETLQIGANELLTEVDVRNCTKLKQPVDMSGCTGLERVYATGSALTAVTLPIGGKVKYLELPDTITNLTIRNNKQFQSLTMEGYDSLATLRIENTPNIPIEEIVNNAPLLERVRLIGIEWTATSEEVLQTTLEKLASCGGLDATAGNTEKAVVNGRVNIESISGELLEYIYDTFPELVVVINGEVSYLVRYINGDGSVLYKYVVAEGEDAIDPIAAGYITETPTKEGTEDVGYVYSGWGTLPTNIRGNVSVVAQFTEAWPVRYYNGDELLYTLYVVDGGNAVDPIEAGYITETPTKDGGEDVGYAYSGWDSIPTNVTGATNVYATFTEAWAVRFYNGDTLLNTQWIVNGGNAVDPVSSGTITAPTKESTAQYNYSYSGWDKAFTNITGVTNVYATFTSTVRYYTVVFYNDSTIMQTSTVMYGETPIYAGETPTNTSTGNVDDFTFTGWSPKLGPITGDTYYYAIFKDNREITDSWETIIANVNNGTAVDKYSVGAFKNMNIGEVKLPYEFYNGSAVVLNDEIHILGSYNSSYRTYHYKWDGTSWTSVSTLPYRFYVGSAVVFNNEIHILGGSGDATGHYKWDGTSWTSVSTLPYSFYEGSAVVFNDEIHILGTSYSLNSTSHYKWDGTSWTSVSTLPYDFKQSSAVVYNNDIHIMGGMGNTSSHYKWDGSSWTKIISLPYTFYDGSAVVFNNEIHVFGTKYSSNYTSHYKYNGSAWSSVSTLPYDFYQGSAVVFDDKVHILGGGDIYVNHYTYSPTTGTWSPVKITETIPMQLAGIEHDELIEGAVKWEGLGELPYEFYQGSAVVFNNEIHILGGATSMTNHYKWDGTSWTSVSTLPYDFKQSSAVVLNGEIHILGGANAMTNHYKWDGTSWTSVSTLPYYFYYGSAVVYNNEIHIFGTINGSSNGVKHYKYDGSTWTSVSTLPYRFYQGSAVVYNGEIHILGSYTSGNYTKHYKWDGTSWTSVSTLPYDFYYGYSVVYDDTIVLLGGYKSECQSKFVRLLTTSWMQEADLPISSTDVSKYVSINGDIHMLHAKNYHYKWDGTSWTSVSTLPYDMSYGSVVVLGNDIHILGGTSATTNHYKWDGSTWTSVSTLPYEFKYSSAVVYNNEIHILGSYTSAYRTYHYKWDGTSWTSVSTLPYEFCNGSAVVLNNEIHILGSESATTNHYKWDGSTWTSVSTLPKGLTFGSACMHNSNIYITGGDWNSKTLYKWNGSIWSSDGDLPATAGRTASLISHKTHLVYIGGKENSYSRSHYTLRNPKATLTFIAKNVLSEGRLFHSSSYGYWQTSTLRAYLNGDEFIASLPEALQTEIKTVNKVTDGGYYDRTLRNVLDKIWLLSGSEVGYDIESSNGQGDVYSIFTDKESRVRSRVESNSGEGYWLRSTHATNSNVMIINMNGDMSGLGSNLAKQHILIGFCL